MRFVDTKVVFREVPDEVTLAINISGCPVGCPGCHSSYLAGDIGEPLDEESLVGLIDSNRGITCVSFMGGDADPLYVRRLATWVKKEKGLKTCWYSGRGIEQAQPVLEALDFVKVGPYIEERGPLDAPGTNQVFYSICHDGGKPSLTDITYRFKRNVE